MSEKKAEYLVIVSEEADEYGSCHQPYETALESAKKLCRNTSDAISIYQRVAVVEEKTSIQTTTDTTLV